MIKLKSLLKESTKSDKKDSRTEYETVVAEMPKFFNKNKKKLENLMSDDIKGFYELGYKEFPDADQDDVAQEMNKCAAMAGFLTNEDVPEMPSEKDLETMAFGDKKSLGKGIKMGDYDKKNKSPKNKEEDLVQPLSEKFHNLIRSKHSK